MSGKREGETLAGASERRLQALISKRGKRSNNATAELDASFKAAQEATGLPKAARAQGPSGTCGAPAKADWDEKAEEDNLPDLEEDDEEDWEAEDSDGDGQLPLPPGDLELDIDAVPGVAASEDQDTGKRPLSREERVQKMWEDYYRKQANQRRAELQQVLHRSSALCTLAHALLLDQAANDPMLQAVCYSLINNAIQSEVLPIREGCSPGDLGPTVSWFSKSVSVSLSEDTIKQAEKAPPDGIEGAVSRLRALAAARTGMPEELVALFVAAMRAQGLLARSVRALDVLPLRPGRTEGRRRLTVVDPRRHKPDSAKGSAPRGPVQPIGPENSKRAPAKRRASASKEASPPIDAAASNGKGVKRKRKTKAEKAQEAEAQASPAAEALRAAESGDNSKENIAELMQASAQKQGGADAEPGASAALDRKRRGDMEFENQLAMAMQASAAAPATKRPSASEVKHGDIPGGVAMRVKGKAPAEPQANGSTSAHDITPQSKRQKVQSPGKKPAGAMWTRGARKPSGGRCWAEVYCGSAESGSWVHVDPLSGVVDRAYEIEKGFVRETPLTYVVALSGNTAKDVTQRYVKSMRPLQKLRDEEWWGETMAGLRPTLQQSTQPQRRLAHTSSLKSAKRLGKERAESGALTYMLSAREDAEFQQKASAEIQDVPNTIPAFKSHPKYVLDRHITRYDMLKPNAQKIGLHRGEAFYLRADLAHLHTAEMWERQGRAVRDSELGQPAKEVRKRGAKDEPVDSRAAEEEAEMFGEPDRDDPFGSKEKDKGAPEVTKLYGDWQTEEWIPPKAENGIVPKNDRGNVLCPPLAYCLPQGTVHLKGMPRITMTCKALELDYAVAMVGFETRGGMSVPCFDGVVVCEEHAELITDAYHTAERERQEKAASKAHAAAEAHWRNLLRSIFTRLHVQGQYADAAATPEIGQVPSPVKHAEVIDATSEQEEEQEKPRAKSGAAAAAAIEAAKGDAAALKQRRATWKDPVVAAREAALQASASAAAPAPASTLTQPPSDVKAEGSRGPGDESMEADAAASPASKGRRTRAGKSGPQKRGRRGAKQTDKVTDKEGGDADELNKQQRKRTRSGLVVDLEEI